MKAQSLRRQCESRLAKGLPRRGSLWHLSGAIPAASSHLVEVGTKGLTCEACNLSDIRKALLSAGAHPVLRLASSGWKKAKPTPTTKVNAFSAWQRTPPRCVHSSGSNEHGEIKRDILPFSAGAAPLALISRWGVGCVRVRIEGTSRKR